MPSRVRQRAPLMRKMTAVTFMLVAWLCANGATWDVVQVLAWTRMFAAYSVTLPPAEALQRTLDPGKPCALCKIVKKARAAQPREGATKDSAKETDRLVFVAESSAVLTFSSDDRDWPGAVSLVGPARVDPVVVPPPRA